MSQQRTPRPRRYLSADALIKLLRKRFEAVPDRRRAASVTYSMADALSGAFAMFSLKEPSLLAFQNQKDQPAIKKLYQLDKVPSDSGMREILDGIELEQLKAIVVEDGRSSNAPHIADLQQLNLRFLLIAKPGDHGYLFSCSTSSTIGKQERLASVLVG